MTLLPEWITALRTCLGGITQQALAEMVDVTRMTVWRWEHGETWPPRVYRMALSDLARQCGHEPLPVRWRA